MGVRRPHHKRLLWELKMNNTISKRTWQMLELCFVLSIGFFVYADFVNIPTILGILFITGPLLNKYFTSSQLFFWISVNVLRPRTKFNPYIWGNFLLFFGLFAPLQRKTAAIAQLEEQLFSSIEFWVAVIAVILANVIVGILGIKKRSPRGPNVS